MTQTKMVAVRIARHIEAPPPLVLFACGEILQGIATQQGPWKDFTLHIDLCDAGLADVGYIAIPIALAVAPFTETSNQWPVTIAAARHPEAFPKYEGAIGVDVSGPSGASVWIGGSYSTPASVLGAFVDATLLRGIAQKTLENFMDDLESACRARIDKQESDYVRYHFLRR